MLLKTFTKKTKTQSDANLMYLSELDEDNDEVIESETQQHSEEEKDED